ncbi:MAG: endospore germination permease [Clostridiales bacterium]|nr:endospore germination permease [Clostridiales bacterium]
MLKQSRTISKMQMLFSIACFIQASMLLTSFFTPVGGSSSWLAVISSYLVFAVFTIPLIMLIKNFPDKNLFQINAIVFGKVGGKIVSAIYLIFFWTLSSLNTKDIGVFLQQTVMTKTPTYVTIFFLMFLCAWATRKGLSVVTRYASFFFGVSMIIMIFSFIFSYNLMDFSYFLPILDIEPIRFIQTTNVSLNIPLGEIIFFLMIHPEVRDINKNSGKVVYIGSFMGMLNILLVVIHDTAILGEAGKLFTIPTFETLRMISIGDVLSRVEILFAIMLMLLLFFKISFMVYVTTISIAEILEIKDYRRIAFITAALVYISSYIQFNDSYIHAEFGITVAPLIWTFIEFFLPFLTLMIFIVKQKYKKGSEQTA